VAVVLKYVYVKFNHVMFLWFHKDRIPAGDVTVLTPLQSEMQFFSYTTNALYE